MVSRGRFVVKLPRARVDTLIASGTRRSPRAASSAPPSAWRCTGCEPVPEIQFSDFIFPAFDQIVNELAKYRYRSGGQYAAPVTIRTPGRRRHQGRPLPLAEPGGAVHPHRGADGRVPSNPYDAKGLLLASAIRSRGSGALLRAQARLPRGQGRGAGGRVHHPASARRRCVREGKQVTVIAWGAMLHEALDAVNEAAKQGYRLRADRSADALARRHRRDHRERPQDRPRHRRARGAADLRLRRGARQRSSPSGASPCSRRRPCA